MATPYSFVQPIRYYKANDPYYYEVDNIPLRQLEENILFLKEKIEGGGGTSTGGGSTTTSSRPTAGSYLTPTSELSITNIKQLKPKCSGQDRTVTVNAGVFTARINDAYNIAKPLGELLFNGAPPTGLTLIPQLKQIWTDVERDSVWNAFVQDSGSGGCPYNVNGLSYTYTFHSSPGGLGGNWGVTASTTREFLPIAPGAVGVGEDSGNYPHYTNSQGAGRWPGASYGRLTPAALGQLLSPSNNTYVYENLPTIHLAFVQMWRGVFRTAVVDFPDSTIDIPAWSSDDYYYYDEQGIRLNINNATQRIDLLVAYSMPIDSLSGTLQDYSTGFCNTGSTPTPTLIQAPQLGLIRGAGVGIKKDSLSSPPSIATTEGCAPPPGSSEIPPGAPGSKRLLANQHDTTITSNYGITNIDGVKVHGSFPSPDDLLNMAPLLALDVDADNFQLVGQTALPLAYIVVNEVDTLVEPSHIIDIRPFLRTTEFTYNERAGVAGANPPLSLANPAVGLFQLQDVVTQLDTKITSTASPSESGKALYTDYVMGGIAYGVEGTLLTMNENSGDPEDPWGSQTTTTTYVDPGPGGASYDFSVFNSSKAFLESQDEDARKAFLQYVYTTRQSHLKRWISDPNSPYSTNTGTYLGLPAPATGGRNIPLYPEWDMPMDGTNYATVMGEISTPFESSPKPTWWMWFEGMNKNRTLSYVPGAVTSPIAGRTSTYLNKRYGFGFGSPQDVAVGIISVVTKELEITFPSWVNDYDVLVEYINCGPVTATQDATNILGSITTGFGSGLYINKGPVVSIAGLKKAVFRINSASQARPETTDGMIVGGGLTSNIGRITDGKGDTINVANLTGRVGAITNNYAYQWLSYTVCLPQFKNTNYGMAGQAMSPQPITRYAPKFGASYYPTVKFTVIGYKIRPSDSNTAYNASNNWTLLQNTIVGDPALLIQNKAPLQSGAGATSKIDIQSI